MRFLHKFLRAVGFSQYTEKKQVQKLIRDIIIHADERSYTTVGKKTLVAEFDRNFAEDIGIAVCGEFDEDDTYSFDYYLPYLRSDLVSTAEDISIERHAAKESYAGICDDPKVGVSLIFYLQNMISYLKLQGEGKIPAKGTSLNLSRTFLPGNDHDADSEDGMAEKKKIAKDAVQRNRLIQAARGGDEEAMESLTLEDMDTYTSISRKIQKADIFSLVDTYFMPYGVECDQYSVLGEITDMKLVTNGLTGEKVHILTLCCNDLNLKVAINSIDLLGEPAVGRRFKGSVWLQGQVNFPEES